MKTKEDIEKVMKQELDEEDLELVRGGRVSSGGCAINYCLFDYECYAVYKIPMGPDDYDDCVLNYLCHIAFCAPDC